MIRRTTTIIIIRIRIRIPNVDDYTECMRRYMDEKSSRLQEETSLVVNVWMASGWDGREEKDICCWTKRFEMFGNRNTQI